MALASSYLYRYAIEIFWGLPRRLIMDVRPILSSSSRHRLRARVSLLASQEGQERGCRKGFDEIVHEIIGLHGRRRSETGCHDVAHK